MKNEVKERVFPDLTIECSLTTSTMLNAFLSNLRKSITDLCYNTEGIQITGLSELTTHLKVLENGMILYETKFRLEADSPDLVDKQTVEAG